MARITLQLPEHFFAAIAIPVRITDLNYGNHVGNDAFVSIIHEAREQWLQQHHFSELNIGGKGLIMSDLSIVFKQESFYGDTITVQLGAGEISKVSFELYYVLSATREGEVVVLANARTTMVCYDYANKKVAALPEAFKQVLS